MKQFYGSLRKVAMAFIMLLTISSMNAQMRGLNYPYGNMPSSKSNDAAWAAYDTWKNGYLVGCGGDYRVAFDDASQTVSEGIAYGMLLAAYAGDKDVFDGLLRYYNKFKNADGVMDWKIQGCSSVIGTGGAADAEFDYALACIVAEKQFGNDGAYNYGNYARDMIAVIKSTEIAPSGVVRPGPHWGGDDLTNPSYFTPAYFRVFGEYTSDAAYWNGVAEKCYEVIANIKSTLNPSYGLVPDWCTASGGFSQLAAEIGYYQSGTKYHYDAARTPWRLTTDYLWYGSNGGGEYANQCFQFADAQGGLNNIKAGYNMDGSSYGGGNSSTFIGSFAVSYMYGPAGQAATDGAYNYFASTSPGGYFNTTLHALYIFTMTGNFWNPLNVDPPVCDAVQIPATIEAEDYCDMNDVQTEPCDKGGLNVGYINNDSWMSYKINVPSAGTYTVTYDIASDGGGGELQLDKDAGQTVLGTVNIHDTQGWQNWETVSHTVNLPAGEYEIGIKAITGGWNINNFNIGGSSQKSLNVTIVGSGSVSPNGGSFNDGETVTLIATPDAGQTFTGWSGDASGTNTTIQVVMNSDKNITATFSGGCTVYNLPTRIEAENYCEAYDVQTEPTTPSGTNVGWINLGSWMMYKVNVPSAGTYDFNFQLASLSGSEFTVGTQDGSQIFATVTVPATGDWQAWQTVPAQITLPAGNIDLKITSTNANGWNFDWFEAGTSTGYTLITNVIGSGSINVTPQKSSYNAGETVTLEAIGSNFEGWSGDASGMSNPITITMNADKSVTATFGGDDDCTSYTPISLDFTYDGLPQQCWETTEEIDIINSWAAEKVEINGVDITNIWVNSFPAKIDGKYYITFKGLESWAHIEITGKNKSAQSSAKVLSVKDIEQLNGVKAYPVPLRSGDLTIKGTDNLIDANLKVLDLSGKEVYTQKINSIETRIAKDNFNKGYYIIEISKGAEKQSIKLIVE